MDALEVKEPRDPGRGKSLPNVDRKPPIDTKRRLRGGEERLPVRMSTWQRQFVERGEMSATQKEDFGATASLCSEESDHDSEFDCDDYTDLFATVGAGGGVSGGAGVT